MVGDMSVRFRKVTIVKRASAVVRLVSILRHLLFGGNRVFYADRFFTIFAGILLAATLTGCATPLSVTSLDQIHEREKNDGEACYGYRCTAGAHRGASEEYRENTLAALIAADSDSKYAFIEFDVQYSKDKRIVVYHDKRMLRLYGTLRTIGNTTFEELSEITDGEIAAYDAAIAVLKKKINIEIKSSGDSQEDERLVDEIIADIRARKRDKDIMISSISKDVVKYVNRKYPDVPTGQVFWLTSSTYLHFESLTKKLYEDIGDTQADYLLLHVANLSNIDDLLKFKPRGKTIMFWDFDDIIYIVHKDISDRLWGTSGIHALYQTLRYKVVSLFR